MRITILQPNYISWRGYFDFFKQSDVFVFYNDVQYTRQDWRNRNLIKTPDGTQWLTIPVEDSGRTKGLLIKDVKIIHNDWQERHLNLIKTSYKDAPYFGEIFDLIGGSLNKKHEFLVDLNIEIIRKVMDYLGIRCKLLLSSEIGFSELKKTERLLAICRHLNATEYLSGDTAKGYLEPELFGDIRVLWHRYYERVYPQLWGEFLSRVSIIDLLFNCGIKGYEII